MATSALAGCFGEEEETEVIVESEFFNFEISNQTWYHYPGGINAMNNTSALGVKIHHSKHLERTIV